jgi:hypothetical protein
MNKFPPFLPFLTPFTFPPLSYCSSSPSLSSNSLLPSTSLNLSFLPNPFSLIPKALSNTGAKSCAAQTLKSSLSTLFFNILSSRSFNVISMISSSVLNSSCWDLDFDTFGFQLLFQEKEDIGIRVDFNISTS